MSGIFISYRRGDGGASAGRLYDRLERDFSRDQIFFDVDTIRPGVDFIELLQEKVDACDVLLAVIGRGWSDARDEDGARRLDNPDDFVRIELARALSAGKHVIPVLVDGAPMPRSDRLPDDIKSLVRRNAVRLSHESFKIDSDRLARSLKESLAAIEVGSVARKAWRDEGTSASQPIETAASGSDEPTAIRDPASSLTLQRKLAAVGQRFGRGQRQIAAVVGLSIALVFGVWLAPRVFGSLRGGPDATLESGKSDSTIEPATDVATSINDQSFNTDGLVPLGGDNSVAMEMPGDRLALVIANDDYLSAPDLPGTRRDKDLIVRTLRDAGFSVTAYSNLGQTEMKRALLEFGRAVRAQNIEAAFLYYSGHAVQSGDENYLLPVDAALTDEDELDIQGVSLNSMLTNLQSSMSGANIIVMDACRKNPFDRSFRTVTQGLAPIDAPRGSLVAYPAAPGKVVSNDEKSEGGMYARALAEAIETRGIPLESVFKRARHAVAQRTAGGQLPWETSSLVGDFYFFPEPAGASKSSTNLGNADTDVTDVDTRGESIRSVKE